MSDCLFKENWNPEIQLKEYLSDIYKMIDKYHQNEAAFKANQFNKESIE